MNLKEYQSVFIAESQEYLSILGNALLLLEKNPKSPDSINEIFRATHTLKGMSATMGYDAIAKLTHQMESVLEPIRSGQTILTSQLIDVLLLCLDQLEKWIQQLNLNNEIEDENLSYLIDALINYEKPIAVVSQNEIKESNRNDLNFQLNDEEIQFIADSKQNGYFVWEISTQLDEVCIFKEARIYMISKTLNEIGKVVKSYPNSQEVVLGNELTHIVISKENADWIQKKIMSISEVKNVQIKGWQDNRYHVNTDEVATSADALKNTEDKNLKIVPAPKVSKDTFSSIVRIKSDKLDRLMNLIQELMIIKVNLDQILSSYVDDSLLESLRHFRRTLEQLQGEVMQIRLIPIKQVFDRFPRIVRDLSKQLNKDVSLEINDSSVEIDRTIVDEIGEPLNHLVRNAIDHGIENSKDRLAFGKSPVGLIQLEAKREKSFISISVTDDGQGLDVELIKQKALEKKLVTLDEISHMSNNDIINLIALPGFTTREKANEISGRGVGVDIAKTKVESLGGNFKIQSWKGKGTTFIFRFPLTMAIIKALIIRCNNHIFAIPIGNVIETLDVLTVAPKVLQQRPTIVHRNEILPLYNLRELLEFSDNAYINPELSTILILEIGDAKLALIVDEVVNQIDIAIKPLEAFLKELKGLAGATILGNGQIAFVLDILGLLDSLKTSQLKGVLKNEED